MPILRLKLMSSVFDEVRELSDDITKNLQAITGGKQLIKIGFQIGIMSVSIPENRTPDDLLKEINEKLKSLDCWVESDIC